MSAPRRTIEVSGGALPVEVHTPGHGSGPGIVLVQEIFGISSYIEQRAADLAELGYLVHVPDLYWRLGEPALAESAPDALAQAMGRAGRLPWDDAVSDTVATVRALAADPLTGGRVGLLGFCYGGGVAFAAAAQQPVDALVSYYGSALADLLHLAPKVTVPSLHHFGEADAYLSTSTVETITAAVTASGAQVRTYPGADHAFDNPSPQFHHAGASALAWEHTVSFLKAHLPAS